MKKIARQQYDFYFLCNTDLPWVKDDLREYPEHTTRQKIFHMYKDILINTRVPWAEIGGTDSQRLQTAVSILDTIFTKRK